MTVLRGRLTTSGHGTRVPVRVEHPDGSLAALTTSSPDGSWDVEVPAGEYVVRPRWLPPTTATTTGRAAGALAPMTVTGPQGEAVATTMADTTAGAVRWTVRHGDTARSPIWAVLDATGDPLDLTGWTVRAQARATAGAKAVLREWTAGHGATVGTATVELASGATVTTSTIQLEFDPGDYRWIPATWTGVFDVEIELPSTTPGAAPQSRYTVVPNGELVIVSDVTRAHE